MGTRAVKRPSCAGLRRRTRSARRKRQRKEDVVEETTAETEEKKEDEEGTSKENGEPNEIGKALPPLPSLEPVNAVESQAWAMRLKNLF